jgi:predicted RNA-binding protein YlqC (UPF0109 family)
MPSQLNIDSLKVKELKEELKKRGLSTVGRKAQLAQALKDAIAKDSETTEEKSATKNVDNVPDVSESTVKIDVTLESKPLDDEANNNTDTSTLSPPTTEDTEVTKEESANDKKEQAPPSDSSAVSVLGGKRSRDDDKTTNATIDTNENRSEQNVEEETGEVASKRPRIEQPQKQQQGSTQPPSWNGSQAAAFLGGGEGGQLKSEEFVNQATNMIQLKLYVPARNIGCVIGRGGSLVKSTRAETGCGMQIPRDNTNGTAPFRVVIIDGMRQQVEHARKIVEGQVAANILDAKNKAAASSSQSLPLQNNSLRLPTKQLQIPNEKTGGLIGRGGSVIKWLRNASMCSINIQNNNEVPPGATVRIVTLQGTQSQIDHAEQLILQKLSEVNSAPSQNRMGIGGPNTQTTQVSVPQEHVGRIIGKGGSHLKHIREQTGCNVHVEKGMPGDQLRTVTFNGTLQQIQQAQYLISAKMQESQKYQQQQMMASSTGGYQHQANPYGNAGYNQQYNPAMQQRQYPYGGNVNTYQTPYNANNMAGVYNSGPPQQQQQQQQQQQYQQQQQHHRYNPSGYPQNNMYGTYGK